MKSLTMDSFASEKLLLFGLSVNINHALVLDCAPKSCKGSDIQQVRVGKIVLSDDHRLTRWFSHGQVLRLLLQRQKLTVVMNIQCVCLKSEDKRLIHNHRLLSHRPIKCTP